MDYIDYSTQGQELWCEVHRLRRDIFGRREELWHIALQAAMMFCRTDRQLYNTMMSYDRQKTFRLWYTRDVRVKVDTFIQETRPGRQRQYPYDERWHHYENRSKIAELLDITKTQAHRLNLQYTVHRTWAVSVKYHRSDKFRIRDWSAFQRAGTRQNAINARTRAQRATDLHHQGLNVYQIARQMLLSVRTIYRYLAKRLEPTNVYRSLDEILAAVNSPSLIAGSEATAVRGRIESAFQWPVTAGMKWKVLHQLRRIIYRKSVDP